MDACTYEENPGTFSRNVLKRFNTSRIVWFSIGIALEVSQNFWTLRIRTNFIMVQHKQNVLFEKITTVFILNFMQWGYCNVQTGLGSAKTIDRWGYLTRFL